MTCAFKHMPAHGCVTLSLSLSLSLSAFETFSSMALGENSSVAMEGVYSLAKGAGVSHGRKLASPVHMSWRMGGTLVLVLCELVPAPHNHQCSL
jgi:hypothetical protein